MGKWTKEEFNNMIKDPRWQKKRLEILQRDNFTCQNCSDTETTLHVHHRKYLPDVKYWDYPEKLLVTLCEGCHENETEYMNQSLKRLDDAIREKFFAFEIDTIAMAFEKLNFENVCKSEEMANSISYFIFYCKRAYDTFKKFSWHREIE